MPIDCHSLILSLLPTQRSHTSAAQTTRCNRHSWFAGLLLSLVLGILAACGSGSGSSAGSTGGASTITVEVKTRSADGSAVSGVSVAAVGGTAVLSNAQGSARLSLANNQTVTLRMTHSAYGQQVKVLKLPAGSSEAVLEVTLIPREAAQTLADIGVGGALTGKDGAKATFPAGSLVDASGNAVSGAVQVQLTPVNVIANPAAFPGSFSGSQGGAAPVAIVSFGTAEFHPTQGGQKLQIAPGKTVEIEIPIYADKNPDGSAVTPGQVIPLWSLNETTGVWVQEGTGTVVTNADSPSGLALRASVSHFSWWNCDDIAGDEARVDVFCKLLDASGNPTVDLPAGTSCSIRAEVPDARRRPVQRADDIINSNGLLNARVPANTPVVIYGESRPGGFAGLSTLNVATGSRTTVIIPLSTPVSVSLISPLEGAGLGSSANASAQVGSAVDRVELYLGGVLVAQSATSPYNFSFSTANVPEGAMRIEARAIQAGRVVGFNAPRNVFVDRSAPVVNLQRLNATAGDGKVALRAQVSDLSPIAKVEFFKNGAKIGEDLSFPFEFTYTLQNGEPDPVSFTATAIDAVGNSGSSNSISFGTRAPTVSLARSPATATLTSSQPVTFTATAASSNGVDRVEFYKGASLIGTDTSAPYEVIYTVTGADQPSLAISARVVDSAGNSATANMNTPVSISSSDTTAPTVALDVITSPVTLSSLSLSASASDNVGVAKVDFFVNNLFKGSSTTPSNGKYSVTVDVSLLSGATTFEARAFDAAGNTASSSRSATVRIPVVMLASPGELAHVYDNFCAPSVAIASDGTPYVAHLPRAGGLGDVQVSRRVGGAWQSLGFANDTATTQVQRGDGNYCPNLVIAADGAPTIAFTAVGSRTVGASSPVFHLVRRYNGTAWSDIRSMAVSTGGARMIMKLDALGRPLIAMLVDAQGSTSLRAQVEVFDGSAWQVRASGLGGSENVYGLRMAVRPDNSVVLALHQSPGSFSLIPMLTIASNNAVTALPTAATTASNAESIEILDVATNASAISLAYLRGGSNGLVVTFLGYDANSNSWVQLGSSGDQMSSTTQAALAYQGNSLVHVTPASGATNSRGRRWDGTSWSSFTLLSPVNSAYGWLELNQGSLYYVYHHTNSCCGPDGAALAKIDLP